MEQALDYLKQLYSGIRDTRIDSDLLDGIMVECYGNKTRLVHIAIMTIRGHSIVVRPYDMSIICNIEKAIHKSGLGLTPQRGVETIMINVPPLYNEQRSKYIKYAKKLAEEAKVVIRNSRRKAIKAGIPKKSVEEKTKNYLYKVDALFKAKRELISAGRDVC